MFEDTEAKNTRLESERAGLQGEIARLDKALKVLNAEAEEQMEKLKEAEQRCAAFEAGIAKARSLEASIEQSATRETAGSQAQHSGAAEALAALHADTASLSPEELAITAWSCETFSLRDDRVLQEITAQLAGSVEQLTPRGLCDVNWVLSKQASPHEHTALCADISSVARANIEEFRPAELSKLLGSIAGLAAKGVQHDTALLSTVSSAVAKTELQPQELVGLATSMAELDYVDEVLLDRIGDTLLATHEFEVLE